MAKILRTIIVLLVFVTVFGKSWQVYAQAANTVIASNLTVADQSIGDGDVVEISSQGIVKSKTAYSDKLVGVAVGDPTIVLHQKTATTRAIVSGGEATVHVTAKNGAIIPGDFITSSDVPGYAEKARQPGYVLGIAKTAFTPPNSNTVGTSSATGTIQVIIDVHYAATAPSDLGGPISRIVNAFTSSIEDQSKIAGVIRYVIGSLVAMTIFMISAILFTRTVRASIEALGRNPLARSSIQMSIIINVIMTLLVTCVGLAMAYLIIRI